MLSTTGHITTVYSGSQLDQFDDATSAITEASSLFSESIVDNPDALFSLRPFIFEELWCPYLVTIVFLTRHCFLYLTLNEIVG